jgi:hypothetical protein
VDGAPLRPLPRGLENGPLSAPALPDGAWQTPAPRLQGLRAGRGLPAGSAPPGPAAGRSRRRRRHCRPSGPRRRFITRLDAPAAEPEALRRPACQGRHVEAVRLGRITRRALPWTAMPAARPQWRLAWWPMRGEMRPSGALVGRAWSLVCQAGPVRKGPGSIRAARGEYANDNLQPLP